jgi:DNA replication and checkpoint protein
MDKAWFLNMDKRRRLASECHGLRTQLKDWERSFAENNSGRKPGKEDIKKNSEIAAKYKTYNRTRDVLDGKKDVESLHMRSPSVHKHKFTSSLKSAHQGQPKTPKKTLFDTPRRAWLLPSDSHPSTLDPYDPPPASVSPHTYVFKNAIGPTPQRGGEILGLFDFLSTSGSTPSTRKRKADCLEEKQSGVNVAQTPCRKSTKGEGGADLPDRLGQSPEIRRHSRTPASDGKKFLLSQFFATPTTLRFAAITEDPVRAVDKAGVNQTPLRADVLAGHHKGGERSEKGKALETTPAFLRRTTSFNQRLITAAGSTAKQSGSNTSAAFKHDGDLRKGPSMRPFRGRALSEILRGLRQMEDNDDEDEMDALREMEGNTMNVLSGDGPSAADHPTLGEKPTRIWKKKGQKRTTRRVIMRPATDRSWTKNSDVDEGDAPAVEDEDTAVDETQAPASVLPSDLEHARSVVELQPLPQDSGCKEKNHSSDMPAAPDENDTLGSDSDLDELASPTLPKERKALSKSASNAGDSPKARPEHGADKKNKKKGVNPNAQSHMNFRSLKLRNRNSKGNGGQGKFGRGRR